MRLVDLSPGDLDTFEEYFRADFGKKNHAKTDWGTGIRNPVKAFPSVLQVPIKKTLIHPLTAISRPDNPKPVLISGFRSYYAAKGNSKLRTIVYTPEDLSDADCFRQVRKAALPEWVYAGWSIGLQKISPATHTSLEMAGLIQRASKALHVPIRDVIECCPGAVNSGNASAIHTAATIPWAQLKRFQSWGLDVAKTVRLSRYAADERPLAAVISCCLFKLSVSRMKQFEMYVRDIALRERRSLHDVLKDLKRLIVIPGITACIMNALEDAGSHMQLSDVRQLASKNGLPSLSEPGPDSADQWFLVLDAIRSPERTQLTRQFRKQVSTGNFPDAIRISHPADFETDTLDITLHIRSLNDLHRAAEILSQSRKPLQKLLHLVQKGFDDPD